MKQELRIKGKRGGGLGFTLIELMVAISIIAILAAVGLVVYGSAQKTARISKRVQDILAIKTALETYKAATGYYPNNIYTTPATCANTATALAALVPSYMPSLPADPLGGTNCYLYSSNAAANSVEYKLFTNVTSAGEMGNTEYRTQLGLIDPERDGGTADDCAVGAGTVTAWAVYATLGTASTNACAY